MTIEIEDVALARLLDNSLPPYGSGNPPGRERPSYPTAEQELAAALEGQAPTLAREVAGLLGPFRTAKLAQAIGRAVAVGIRRRADEVTAQRMTGLYDLLAEGLHRIDVECVAPEPGEVFVEPACEHGNTHFCHDCFVGHG